MPQEPASALTRDGKILLTLLCLAQFMLILDVAVVAVAVPAIQTQFNVSSADVQWVSTAYGLTFGGFLVVAGRIADLMGPKRILIIGMIVFTCASGVCGFALDELMLFIARALQGFGAALVSPAALSLVTTSFGEGAGRNKAIGLWGAVSSGGAIAGQLLGGVLTDLAGWRSIFLINLPIGVIVIAAVIVRVQADQKRDNPGRLDLTGAGLLTAGVVLLVTSVTQSATRGFDSLVLTVGLAAIVVLALFVLHEKRVATPIVRLSMFRNPNVRYGNVIIMVASGGASVSVFFSTLYMQEVLGLTPLQAGLGFIPVTALILVVSMRTNSLVQRLGIRTLLLASAAFFAVGFVLLSFVPASGGTYWTHILPGLTIAGLGAALSFAPSMLLCTTGVPDEEQGLASGLLSTSQQLGAALVLAALNTVVAFAAVGATAEEALANGSRMGYLGSLAIPVLMTACVLLLPRKKSAAVEPTTVGDEASA